MLNSGPENTQTIEEDGFDLFLGWRHEGVFDAEDDVRSGAAGWALLQELPTEQRGRQAGHSMVTRPPCFTVVVRLPVAFHA